MSDVYVYILSRAKSLPKISPKILSDIFSDDAAEHVAELVTIKGGHFGLNYRPLLPKCSLGSLHRCWLRLPMFNGVQLTV